MRNRSGRPIVTLLHQAEKKWVRDIRRKIVDGDNGFTKGVIYGLREAKRIVNGYYSEAK